MNREKKLEFFKDEYDDSTTELLSKYDFILDNDSDYVFPEEADVRYELFKNSTCEFEFLTFKWEYLDKATRSDDSTYIKGAILELNKILEDERLTGKTKKDESYKKAVDYFSSILNDSDKDLDDDTKTIFFISLHQNNYFNKVEVPEVAFFLDYPNGKKLEPLSSIYGKYFLLYDYLLSQASKLSLEVKSSQTIKIRKNRIQEIKDKTLEEVWAKGEKDKYDLAIEFLKKHIHNKELNQTFIIENKNGNYTWLYSFDSQKYLAAFIFICMKNEYISPRLTAPQLVSICCNTFSIEDLDKKNFTSLYSNEPKDVYLKPFSLLFK